MTLIVKPNSITGNISDYYQRKGRNCLYNSDSIRRIELGYTKDAVEHWTYGMRERLMDV